ERSHRHHSFAVASIAYVVNVWCRLSVCVCTVSQIFKDAKLPLFLQPYTVLVTSANSGMIQTVPNAVSVDSLKKDTPNFSSLANFFEQYFGPKGSNAFKKAQRNFAESMAAYSVVCYLLQIKDRHNGNILLT